MHVVRKILPLAAWATAALLACDAAGGTKLTPELKKAMHDSKNPTVLMQTSMGDIMIELFKKEAPKSTDNFLAYAKKKHYDGTIFHRVMSNFMIQGGGMDKDMSEKETMPPIVNESSNGLSNETGTLAMARTSAPNSATSQFFINVKDNAGLDKARAQDKVGYAVFGKVIDGMDVVNKIKDVKTGNKGGHQNVPVAPVTIQSVKILQ